MNLCIDIGNTDIHAGVFDGSDLVAEFRKSNQWRPTIDEFGLFLLQILRIKEVDPSAIKAVSIASVVPDAQGAVSGACERYLGTKPLVLRAGVRTGLKLRVKEPTEVGADRIANAIAAVARHPNRDLLVVDTGTATTICVITAAAEYMGGVITPGLGLAMRALGQGTAKLPLVDIVRPEHALGRTTIENIQSGLYFGHVGMLRELLKRLGSEAFGEIRPTIIGTGGFAHLFAHEGIFDEIVPDLVLRGLLRALELNTPAPSNA